MAYITEGFSLPYNPFSASLSYKDQWGNDAYVQDATGQWFRNEPFTYNQGDTDVTSYRSVAIDGSPPDTYEYAGMGDNQYGTGTYNQAWNVDYNYDLFNQRDPNLAADWMTFDAGGFMRDAMGYTNMKPISYDPETGMYITMQKTGDKQGTMLLWAPTEDGGMKVVKNLGTREWDTNKDFFDQSAWKVLSKFIPVAGELTGATQAISTGISNVAGAAWTGFQNAFPEAARVITEAWNAAGAAGTDFNQWLIDNWGIDLTSPNALANATGGAGSQLDPTGLESVLNGSLDPTQTPLDLESLYSGGGTFNDGTFVGPPDDLFTSGSNPSFPQVELPPTGTDPGVQVMDPITITGTSPVDPVPIVPVSPPGGSTTPAPTNPTPTQQEPPPSNNNPTTEQEPAPEQEPARQKGDIKMIDGALKIWDGVKWVGGSLMFLNSMYRLFTGNNLVGPDGPDGPGGPGGGGNDDLLSFIINALGQGASASRQEDAADKLLAMYNDQQQKAAPWEERLARSYTDAGIKDIMSSPEFMNENYSYKQAIDRKAAKAGTLTNSMSGIPGDPSLARGREAALQRFGLEYLDQYRKPLRESVEMYTKNASDYRLLAALGLRSEAAIPGQWGNLFNRYLGSNGYNIPKLLEDIGNFGGSIGAWWDWMTQEPAPGQGAGSDEAVLEFQQRFPDLEATPENLRAYYDYYDFWQEYFDESEGP